MCVRGVLRVRWNLVFIGVEWSCGSLFVGAVIAFGDNCWLVNNSRELIDKVRDMYCLDMIASR